MMDLNKRRHIVSRRQLAVALCGAATMASFKGAAAQEPMPPDFRTARSQFVLLRPGSDVSGVRLRNLDGSTRSLGSFRGKSLLVSLWASWCPPCRRELPILASLQLVQKSEPFEVIPVALDRDPAAAEHFIRKLGLGKLTTYIDPDETFASGPDSPHRAPFPLYGMPMSYVVDRQGRTAGYLVGEADWSSRSALELLRFYGRVA